MKAVLMAALAAGAASFNFANAQNQADTITLHLLSEPSGAKVYGVEKGHVFLGYTPHTINLSRELFIKKIGADGCVTTTALKVEWISGATEYAPQLRMCLGANTNYEKRFVRPAGVDGYIADLRFESMRRDEAASSARYAAPPPASAVPQDPPSSGISFGQALGAILGGMAQGYANNPPPAYEPRRQIQCVSRNEAGNIRTVCE